MGFFNSLFATPETVAKTMETASKGLYNGIDKAFYTDEEKADDQRKNNNFYLKYLEVTLPSNLARRWLAIMVVAAFLVITFMTALAFPFSSEYAKFLLELLSSVLVWPTGLVMAFYFMKRPGSPGPVMGLFGGKTDEKG